MANKKPEPTSVAAELGRAREHLDKDEPRLALERLQAAVSKGAQGEDLVEARFLEGECRVLLCETRKALAAFERALELAPDDPVLLGARGEALFDLWAFADAEKALGRALELDPEDARAHRFLALCLDRRGARAEAEKHFAAAHKLDAAHWPTPVRIDKAAFDALARAAIDSLPAFVKAEIGDVGFTVQDYPRLEQLARRVDDADPQTLGLFFGRDVSQRHADIPPEIAADQVVLFQRNLEQLAKDRAELEEEIETTVYHEVGHYLGYDEEGLEEIGLA